MTSPGSWRWHDHEPNNIKRENCTEMLSNGKYNNVECEADRYYDNPGYICEKLVGELNYVHANPRFPATAVERLWLPQGCADWHINCDFAYNQFLITVTNYKIDHIR